MHTNKYSRFTFNGEVNFPEEHFVQHSFLSQNGKCHLDQEKKNAFFLCYSNNGYPNEQECYFIRIKPMLLICNALCGSGLQDQQTEPVQIHCKQLHSHTSYVCKLATVCNILQSIIRIQI